MTEPISTPDAPALSPEQTAAQVQLDAIMADRSHPYHVAGHPRWEAEAAKVLALRRAALGTENRPVVEYREEPAGLVLGARRESAPLSALYGREDFLSSIPGDVAPAERARAADAVEACGLTWFEGQQVLNATEGPVPAGAMLDLAELWGDAADDNARVVKGLLMEVREKAPDFYDKVLPFIQRRAAVANLGLAVAQRLAQGGGR
jgi:hypothetical protein